MKTVTRIIRYEMHDVLRSRWLLIYTLFFAAVSYVLFRFSGDGVKAALSLMNVVLGLVPLVSIVFGTLYIYHAREFIELLLTQPIRRRTLFLGLYGGLLIPLAGAGLLGMGLPLLWLGGAETRPLTACLLLSTLLMTAIFLALSFLISIRHEDRLKGLGFSILLWLFFAVLYDGIVLLFAFLFREYPLERSLLALMVLNPIDLARVSLLLQSDASLLLGYTGAVFRKFFGSQIGLLVAGAAQLVWVALPLALALRRFVRKDF